MLVPNCSKSCKSSSSSICMESMIACFNSESFAASSVLAASRNSFRLFTNSVSSPSSPSGWDNAASPDSPSCKPSVLTLSPPSSFTVPCSESFWSLPLSDTAACCPSFAVPEVFSAVCGRRTASCPVFDAAWGVSFFAELVADIKSAKEPFPEALLPARAAPAIPAVRSPAACTPDVIIRSLLS